MEIYSPRKNYNFSIIKNELKKMNSSSEAKVKIPLGKTETGEEENEKPVEVMRKKLFERLKLFFDYQDVC